jgi:uncharacterized protein YhbP (UPF0306 family)
MNTPMAQFIENQTCASICCVDGSGKPYCFTCFYVFDKSSALLFFKSSSASHHVELLTKNEFVSGTILPDKLRRWALEGLQFHGEWLSPGHADARGGAEKYHKSYPFAKVMAGEVYAIRLQQIKMSRQELAGIRKFRWERG